jgi:hypothetical protein
MEDKIIELRKDFGLNNETKNGGYAIYFDA